MHLGRLANGVLACLLLGASLQTAAAAPGGGAPTGADVVGATVVRPSAKGSDAIDYENAKPMPLPALSTPPGSMRGSVMPGSEPEVESGPAGGAPGAPGDGKETPVRIPSSGKPPDTRSALDVAPQAWGETFHPFTTSRVDVKHSRVSSYYPFRAAGKLFFRIDGGTYICSGSLIRKGIVVTAAHCVSDFGKSRFYTAFEFWPAYFNGTGPYGKWTADKVYAPGRYLDGTDPCTPGASGVVCRDDVALITLSAQANDYPGSHTGYFGFQYNYALYTDQFLSNTKVTQVSQLGYPRSHDNGEMMQRTDSLGFVDPGSANNTVIGSRQTGGSSGGPWLANLGVPRVLLSDGVTRGSAAKWNRLVGVTSWGYVGEQWKQQGASPFLGSNIRALLRVACRETPAACER